MSTIYPLFLAKHFNLQPTFSITVSTISIIHLLLVKYSNHSSISLQLANFSFNKLIYSISFQHSPWQLYKCVYKRPWLGITAFVYCYWLFAKQTTFSVVCSTYGVSKNKWGGHDNSTWKYTNTETYRAICQSVKPFVFL